MHSYKSPLKPLTLAFSLTAATVSCLFHSEQSLADKAAQKECTPHQEGIASWYGRDFHGRKTASGIPFNMHALVAAHKELPFGTRLRVSFKEKAVIVKVVDRGPYHEERIIDISRKAADVLGLRQQGTGRVSIEICR
jgi:rare lipoprotein A (peptidoglycan hydrolase)